MSEFGNVIRDASGDFKLACTRREDGDYDFDITREGRSLHSGIVVGYKVYNVVAHWRDWLPELEYRERAVMENTS